jgi:hypothetical protein
VVGEIEIFDAYKDTVRPLRAHMLNFAADEPQIKTLTKINSHGMSTSRILFYS